MMAVCTRTTADGGPRRDSGQAADGSLGGRAIFRGQLLFPKAFRRGDRLVETTGMHSEGIVLCAFLRRTPRIEFELHMPYHTSRASAFSFLSPVARPLSRCELLDRG